MFIQRNLLVLQLEALAVDVQIALLLRESSCCWHRRKSSILSLLLLCCAYLSELLKKIVLLDERLGCVFFEWHPLKTQFQNFHFQQQQTSSDYGYYQSLDEQKRHITSLPNNYVTSYRILIQSKRLNKVYSRQNQTLYQSKLGIITGQIIKIRNFMIKMPRPNIYSD